MSNSNQPSSPSGSEKRSSSRKASILARAASECGSRDGERSEVVTTSAAVSSCRSSSVSVGAISATFWSDSSSLSSSSSSSSSDNHSSARKRKSAKKRGSSPDGGKKEESTPASIQQPQPPHRHDVLFGRGKNVNSHPGNVAFRQFVAERKDEYTGSESKEGKSDITRSVFERVRALDPPGRFLERVVMGGDKAFWVEADDTKALMKVSQALRQKPTDRGGKAAAEAANKRAKLDDTVLSATTGGDGPALLVDYATALVHSGASANDERPVDHQHVSVYELNPSQLREEANRVMAQFGLCSSRTADGRRQEGSGDGINNNQQALADFRAEGAYRYNPSSSVQRDAATQDQCRPS